MAANGARILRKDIFSLTKPRVAFGGTLEASNSKGAFFTHKGKTMYEILVLTQDVQEQSFTLLGMRLKLTLRYNRVLRSFQFDLFDVSKNEYIVINKGIAVGGKSLIESGVPFYFTLVDRSGNDLAPTSKRDFYNRISLMAVAL